MQLLVHSLTQTACIGIQIASRPFLSEISLYLCEKEFVSSLLYDLAELIGTYAGQDTHEYQLKLLDVGLARMKVRGGQIEVHKLKTFQKLLVRETLGLV